MNDRGFSLPLQTLIVLIGALLNLFCIECVNGDDSASIPPPPPSSITPLNPTDCSSLALEPGGQCCTEKQPTCSNGTPKVIQENCSTGGKDEPGNKRLYICKPLPPPPLPPSESIISSTANTSKPLNTQIASTIEDTSVNPPPQTLPPNPQDTSHSNDKTAPPPFPSPTRTKLHRKQPRQ